MPPEDDSLLQLGRITEVRRAMQSWGGSPFAGVILSPLRAKDPASATTRRTAGHKAAARQISRPALDDGITYSSAYSILIPRRAISSRNISAGTSRSCNTAPRLAIAPEASICTTIEAGKAVVRIMALMSVLGS